MRSALPINESSNFLCFDCFVLFLCGPDLAIYLLQARRSLVFWSIQHATRRTTALTTGKVRLVLVLHGKRHCERVANWLTWILIGGGCPSVRLQRFEGCNCIHIQRLPFGSVNKSLFLMQLDSRSVPILDQPTPVFSRVITTCVTLRTLRGGRSQHDSLHCTAR